MTMKNLNELVMRLPPPTRCIRAWPSETGTDRLALRTSACCPGAPSGTLGPDQSNIPGPTHAIPNCACLFPERPCCWAGEGRDGPGGGSGECPTPRHLLIRVGSRRPVRGTLGRPLPCKGSTREGPRHPTAAWLPTTGQFMTGEGHTARLIVLLDQEVVSIFP